MRKEYLNAHYGCIASRYGINDIDSFKRAARRYECKLHYLAELMCDNERLYKWAEIEAEKVEQQARKNLAKYCRNYKQFGRELYINSDPRGYALKLNIKNAGLAFRCKVDRDWGDYYVLAPDVDK